MHQWFQPRLAIVAIEGARIRAYLPLTDFDHRSTLYGRDAFTYDGAADVIGHARCSSPAPRSPTGSVVTRRRLRVALPPLEGPGAPRRPPTKERHLRPGGTISGPALVWLADLSFYLLLMGRLGPVAAAVTTNLTINFMRKPEPADLLGEGRLMKLGRALAVGDFTIWSEGEQEPVAHATLTYSLPRTAKKG
jgi:acyl-coenzyme A thioesterase PaaI-like protein